MIKWSVRSRAVRWSLVLVLACVVLAILAPLVYAAGPTAVESAVRLQGPSATHWAGTDEYGRDVLSRTAYGLRVSLFIGFATVVLSTVSGVLLGLVSGYFPRIDGVLSRVFDAMMAFPEIVLAITLSAIWGGGVGNIIFALSFAYLPKMARIVRGATLDAKARPYVESGQAAGASHVRLIVYYILPACVSAIIVQATVTFASAVLSEAALSFLGVGIKEPAPSLGNMVSTGRNFMNLAPWMVLVPGTTVFLLVLALNLIGDGLRDYLDPKTD